MSTPRPLVTAVTHALTPPDQAARAAAGQGPATPEALARWLANWPCLAEIEHRPPPAPLPAPPGLRALAWNMERCKRVEESAALIMGQGADLVLATEMDIGMARSGQRNTPADLARALGFGYAYGVEFVELGAGDPQETRDHGDEPNLAGLHGNAILSRYPLEDITLIPLDDGGRWYLENPMQDGQLRVGGRMALAASLRLEAGPITVAAVHLESVSDAALRARQMHLLLDALEALWPGRPAVIGGDLNTIGFTQAGMSGAEILRAPEKAEPLFADLAAHGFSWCGANTPAFTTRPPQGLVAHYPLKKLDWLFVRGLTASGATCLPAVSARGAYLSDHEAIAATIVT